MKEATATRFWNSSTRGRAFLQLTREKPNLLVGDFNLFAQHNGWLAGAGAPELSFIDRGDVPPRSHLAKVVPDPDGAAQHVVGAKLVRETGHLAEVKLRANKKVVLQVDLHTGPDMHLEMARAPHGD